MPLKLKLSDNLDLLIIVKCELYFKLDTIEIETFLFRNQISVGRKFILKQIHFSGFGYVLMSF